MSEVFLGLGGGIFLILGVGHGVLTLQDLRNPTFFTPITDGVREQMAGTAIALNRHANLWRAWLGFNLSHSVGLVVFGATALLFATRYYSLYANSGLLQLAAIIVSAVYVLLAARFWFWGPVVGTAAATACLVVAAIAT